jgi:ribose transport system permease protein
MSRALHALLAWRMGFALAFGIALFIANVLVLPAFISGGQLSVTVGTLAPFALAAMASTPAFLSGGGGIDLSITPLMALCNIVLITGFLGTTLGTPIIAIPLLLLIGAIVGAANGLLVAWLRFPPVIATLAMFFMLSGLDLGLVPNPVSSPPSWVDSLAGSVGPIPGALLTIGVPLAAWVALRRTPLVDSILSVGDNAAASFSAGVNVNAVRVLAYAIGGVLAAIAGIALAGLVQSADAQTYTGYTIAALAAVALGGTNLGGGNGGLLPSIVGATCIYLLNNLLAALHVSSNYVQVAYGGVLLVAVVLGAVVINRSRTATP